MAKHDFRYFFHEGLSNMFRHGFMSFAAIGITVACLLIMGTFTRVAVNANELLRTLEQENEILAYVDDSYSEAQAKALKRTLEGIPNVASATFISKEEAMESFTAQYPDEALFQDLDPEILRDRFAIKVVDLQQQSAAVEAVKAVEGIAKVNAYEEIAGGFITVRNVATVVCHHAYGGCHQRFYPLAFRVRGIFVRPDRRRRGVFAPMGTVRRRGQGRGQQRYPSADPDHPIYGDVAAGGGHFCRGGRGDRRGRQLVRHSEIPAGVR